METTADTLGAYLAAAAAGGIAVHAVATNLRKRRLIKKELETSLKDKNLKPGEKNE